MSSAPASTAGRTGYDTTGSVHRMQARADTVLASDQHPTGAVAVDSTWLYFTDYDGKGSVRRVPRKGGAVETLVACDANCFPAALRVDAQNVYYRDQSGNVFVRSKADGSIRAITPDEAVAAVPILRRKMPASERTIRLPGGPLIPILALAPLLELFVQAVHQKRDPAATSFEGGDAEFGKFFRHTGEDESG